MSFGTWSLGGNLITARDNLGGAGEVSAGLSFSGYDGNVLRNTEEYNGISWSTAYNRYYAVTASAGAGMQNAGLACGGYDSGWVIRAYTEEYNGTSWAGSGNLNASIAEHACAGTQTSALSFGGGTPRTTQTEEYNGISWSIGGSLNIARDQLAGCGSQNAGLSMGGDTGTASNATEEYNGTSWSLGGNLQNARLGLAGAGEQNLAISFGGGPSDITENYNGTNWTVDTNLNNSVDSNAGGLQSINTFSTGGHDAGGYTNTTEEFTTYNLTGIVTDIFSNYIQGAIVSVGNLSDDTDANGNYSITGIPSGQYNITTTHYNYFSDIYNTSIPPTSSYNPILWPLPLQTKDILVINNPIEANEESDIEISISKNFNNSIVTQINKKTEIVYNYVDLILNESAKEMYYDYIGYKIKVLSVPALNQSIPNVFIINYSTEKMKSNTSYWISKLTFLKT